MKNYIDVLKNIQTPVLEKDMEKKSKKIIRKNRFFIWLGLLVFACLIAIAVMQKVEIKKEERERAFIKAKIQEEAYKAAQKREEEVSQKERMKDKIQSSSTTYEEFKQAITDFYEKYGYTHIEEEVGDGILGNLILRGEASKLKLIFKNEKFPPDKKIGGVSVIGYAINSCYYRDYNLELLRVLIEDGGFDTNGSVKLSTRTPLAWYMGFLIGTKTVDFKNAAEILELFDRNGCDVKENWKIYLYDACNKNSSSTFSYDLFRNTDEMMNAAEKYGLSKEIIKKIIEGGEEVLKEMSRGDVAKYRRKYVL